MIYELRIYRCCPGRMQDVLDRFTRDVSPLWEVHGIKQVGFWTVLVGESNQNLVYMIRWDSMADRETKWRAFQGDPAWVTAKTKSEVNGPLIMTISNQLLEPTGFSTLQ